MSLIVKIGKKGKAIVKKVLSPVETHHVSYTRRIERIKTDKRILAMTFDDGPMDSKAKLAYLEGHGYLMLLISSNRYDKGGYFRLGDELPAAIQTLSDLLELYGSLGDGNVTVEPWPGRSCLIYQNRPGWLVLKFDHHAGRCEVRDVDIEKFRKALEERLE